MRLGKARRQPRPPLHVNWPGVLGTALVFLPAIMVVLACVLLAGCVTVKRANPTPPPAPKVETVTVERPVAVSCVPATYGPAPAYPDTDDALRNAVDAAERMGRLAAGRALRIARQAESDTVITGCR